MDVATVCSVLAALGAIEAAAPPDSKAEPDLSLLASTAHPLLNTTTSTVNTSPDTITGPGSVLYGVLSERWQNRLTEYIDDALKSKAAALLNEATNGAADGGGVTSAVKTEGGATNTVNTIAPGVNPNRSLPVSGANSATTTCVPTNLNISTHAAKSVAPSVPMYNPLGSGHSSAATSAGITPSTSCNNIAGAYLTSTLPSPNSTTHNSSVVASPVPNATSISNTARLIAEYNSRNGIDPGTASGSTFPVSNNAVSTAPNPTQMSYSAPLSAPIAGAPMNTAKPVVNYSLPITTNVGSTGAASSAASVPSVGIPGSAPVMNNMTNGPSLSSVNTIGYRAPLGPDATTTNAVYNPLSNSTYPALNGTTTSIPPSYSSTPYVNIPNINTNVGIPSNTLNSSVKPYTVPHSNPATTPATVGFLSVTNPTNKLVLPYMNGDGTLSKSASSSNISNGMSGVGTTVPILNSGVSSLNYGHNTNVNAGLNTSLNTSTNPSYIPNSTAYSNLSAVSTSNIGSVGSSAPLGYQPPGPSYPTTTPMMGYNNNTSIPLNSAPYNNNTMYPMNTANYGASFVTNTTNPALYQPITATNYVNNTNTNSTTANTKTKVKTPKPPAEKKLTKKAAAAASKLDSTNIARVSGAQGMNAVGGSASSSVNGTVTSGTTGVNSNKARRGPSALRVWKLREEYIQLDITLPSLITDSKSTSASNVAKTTNAALALLLDPSLLGSAASMHYAMHSALETEERLLRRIAGLCNINLKPNRYRLGTAMLSSDPDIMNRTSTTSSRLYGTTPSTYTTNSSNAVSTSKASTKYTDTSSTEDFYTEPTYAVYDDTTPITATYLLDKIRRTKRQRGEVLYGNISLPYTATTASVSAARNAAAASVGVYSAPHVHALAAVVSKTADYFWANTSNGKNKSKKAVATVANSNKAEPITMAQYARNVHTGVGGNNIVLSSCSNGASITNHTLRRYAQPIELYNAHLPCDVSKINAFAAATGGHHNTNHSTSATASNNGTTVLSIPDLTLNTREIAWTSIAAEFAILPAPTEEGSIGFGYSASTAAIDTVSGYVDTSATVGTNSVKKRKYLNNDSVKPSKAGSAGSATSGTSKSNTNTNTSSAESNNATASTLAMEVLAPQFTEIVPVTVVVEQMKVCVSVCLFVLYSCFCLLFVAVVFTLDMLIFTLFFSYLVLFECFYNNTGATTDRSKRR